MKHFTEGNSEEHEYDHSMMFKESNNIDDDCDESFSVSFDKDDDYDSGIGHFKE